MNSSIRSAIVCGAFLGSLAAAPLAFAHHSFAYFDMSKNIVYDGTVVEYRWENPHTHIVVKIEPNATDRSTVGTWDIEGGSVNIMARQGWKKSLFKPGDHIMVIGHPMKDGSKGASLYYVQLPDGTKLYHDIARPKEDAQ